MRPDHGTALPKLHSSRLGSIRKAAVILTAAVALLVAILAASPRGRGAWHRISRGQAPLPTRAITPERNLRMPPGFGISVYADGVGGARMMALSPDGVLFVTRTHARYAGNDSVVALPDHDGDGLADTAVTYLSGTGLRGHRPHGLAFHDGHLYVANWDNVIRVPYQPGQLRPAGAIEVVVPELHTGNFEMHFTRTLVFGPDDHMYVSVGSSCNACVESDTRRAAVLRLDAGGQVPPDNPFTGRKAVHPAVFALGLRNSVGIRFQPESGQLWGTNNGRDGLGDDLPSDDVNLILAGEHYGWPYCHGHPDKADRVLDERWVENPQDQDFCARTHPPAVKFQAHVAPLGLEFYSGSQFPAAYRGDLFVAQHGSWNRSAGRGHVGYQVVRVHFGPHHRPTGKVTPFVSGWLTDPHAREFWGRPVDVLQAPDGSLFVSDDFAGRIYRVFYAGGHVFFPELNR
jgi:glucose/arabinose dehydrogenase